MGQSYRVDLNYQIIADAELQQYNTTMNKARKVCPIVFRKNGNSRDVLAFRHPIAGRQFVKGTIELNETPIAASIRELKEESGIASPYAPRYFGTFPIGLSKLDWFFFVFHKTGLPETWGHLTEDDHNHVFNFFWHPMGKDLDASWHPLFHQAFVHILEAAALE